MATERSKLTARVIPSMTLGTGESDPLTAPPLPLSETTPLGRATARFSVTGNAIVTGGTGDIGLVACRALLEHGLLGLVIFDVNRTPEAEGKLAALRLEHPAARIELLTVDVTDAAAVSIAVDEAVTQVGPITTLLCFAGVVDTVHALELRPDAWRAVLDVNATGSFLCAQAVARSMVQAGRGGSIVLTSSISAHAVNFPQPQVHYNVSKAAVLAMAKSLAAEWARYGIRVNTISPGYMDTILNEGPGLAEHRRIWQARNPTGRMGQPEELTGALVLLASRAGSYITGTDILVDGGARVF